MTSKSLFWKYSVWNFKKRLWTFVLCAAACFFIMPVALFVETGTMMQGYGIEQMERNYGWFRYNIINNRIAGGGWYGVLVIAMAVFLALHGFAWIHRQNQVDMFKSVPIKSSTRFWCINLNSLLIFVVSFGGNLVLANIAASIKGIKESWDWDFFDASIVSFLMHLLLFLACYFVVLIAQYLTGNVVLAFLGGAVLLGIESLGFVLKEEMMDVFFRTHFHIGTIYETFGRGIVSPISAYVGMYKTVSEGWLGFANGHNYEGIEIFILMALMSVQILVYGAVAYVLYQKRPAQTGGKSIVFPKLKTIIKFVIMVVGSLCISVFMASFNSEAAIWYGLFGAVCGLLGLQVILQTIMEGDFRESMNGKASFTAAFALTMIIYFAFALDITGYDTYVPKAEQIRDFAFVRGGDFAYDLVDEEGRYVAENEYLLDAMWITDEAAKEQVLSMLQQEIEAGEYYYQPKNDEEFWEEEAVESQEGLRFEDDNKKEELYIKFRLSGGREVVRCYWLRKSAVRNCFEGMYELPEYKAAVYPILSENTALKIFNRNNLPVVTYQAYNLGNGSEQSESLELTRELFDALKEDAEKRRVETVINQAPIGNLEFAAFPEKYMEDYGYNPDKKQFKFSMPIYEEDEATVALLKEIGWYRETEIKAEKVAIITVYQMVNNATARKVMQIKPGAPLFEQVAEALVSYDAASSVPDEGTFVKTNYWAEVTIIPEIDKEEYGYYPYSCELRRDKFPAVLEKAFENVDVEELEGAG